MRALLALEDGFSLPAQSFTGDIPLAGGEVIFNTGMTGYQEVLTDPSYVGQMVCLTWPMVGNYGINPEDMESGKVHLSALLVKECCAEPSNWRATCSLPNFLKEQEVPGLQGLDTRALTLHLREHGAMRGCISTQILDPAALSAKARELPSMEGQKLTPLVAATTPYIWDDSAPNGGKPAPAKLAADGSWNWPSLAAGDQAAPRVLVYDYGIKWNILRQLKALSFDLLVVPPLFSPEAVKAVQPDAIFLSNGPGDPASLKEEIAIMQELSQHYPMGGICLGHQILALALGGRTAKLKFGHHGLNHPVKNLGSGRIEISSQNHGFHVLPENLQPTHINLNDQSLEGFRHPSKPIITVQHHPEAAAGPSDCHSFFEEFKELVLQNRK